MSDRELTRTGPVQRPFRNLQAYLLDTLGRSIVAGEVEPGGTLPTEPELASRYGISKTIVREALRGLAAKGLVEARPRLGTRVLSADRWNVFDPDVLSWLLAAGRDWDLLQDFDELRGAVEPAAARLAASRATPGLLDDLGRALELMREHVDDPAEYFRADVDFHSALLAATDNRFFRGLRETLQAGLRVRHAHAIGVLADMHESLPFHEHVVQAVVRRDPAAAQAAMIALIELSANDDKRLRRQGTGGARSRGGRSGGATKRSTT